MLRGVSLLLAASLGATEELPVATDAAVQSIPSSPVMQEANKPSVLVGSMTFHGPWGTRVNGFPVDFCMRMADGEGADCGQPAADAFCRGLDPTLLLGVHAVSFDRAKANGATWLQGDAKVNNVGNQDSFSTITCANSGDITLGATALSPIIAPGVSAPAPAPPAVQPRSYTYTGQPALSHGFDVDYCMRLDNGHGVDCGQPAADAFCQSVDPALHATAFTAIQVDKQTWLQGSQAINNSGNQQAFGSLTCSP